MGGKGLIMRGLRLQVHVSICKRQTSSWHICGRCNQPQLRESQTSRKRDGHAVPGGGGVGDALGEFNVTKYVLGGPCRLRSIPWYRAPAEHDQQDGRRAFLFYSYESLTDGEHRPVQSAFSGNGLGRKRGGETTSSHVGSLYLAKMRLETLQYHHHPPSPGGRICSGSPAAHFRKSHLTFDLWHQPEDMGVVSSPLTFTACLSALILTHAIFSLGG